MFDVDKILFKIFKQDNETLEKINLGAGDDIKPGWYNHDQVLNKNIDYVFDLNSVPFPLNDYKYDVVYASHVLEHVTNIFPCIEEIHRILKSGGLFIVRVPHYAGQGSWCDLSHKRGMGYMSFLQLTNKDYCNLYSVKKWSSSVFCRLYFFKKWYYPWNFIAEPLSNLKPIYFENTFAYFFPPFEVVTILRK